jgi:ferrous iron transport protein B
LREKLTNVGIIGNPNSGKTSIFNLLTGMRQHTGNFPGVTVDKISAVLSLENKRKVNLIDFPGTYSIHPTTQDEAVVTKILLDPHAPDYPDAVIYVADILDLEKQFLLFTQVVDLGIPVLLILNKSDLQDKAIVNADQEMINQKMGIPVITVNANDKKSVLKIMDALAEIIDTPDKFSKVTSLYQYFDANLNGTKYEEFNYFSFLQKTHLSILEPGKKSIDSEKEKASLIRQVNDTMQRYKFIENLLSGSMIGKKNHHQDVSYKIDEVLTHKIWGPLIFFLSMFIIFQAIFAWAVFPMEWIEFGFEQLSTLFKDNLPAGVLTDLFTEGILAGLSGVLVFIPQIAIMFLLIGILESTGYMARVVYMFDSMMQKMGLNGRSVVSLIAGGACAIPAIMSARTIQNRKERLLTILVTPLISCSARIPVYTILIAFIVPSTTVAGIFNLQGLAFMGFYLVGIIAAFLSALIFSLFIEKKGNSLLALELPSYCAPDIKNVIKSSYDKVKSFVVEAGKIILVISILLWALSSFGPSGQMENAIGFAQQDAKEKGLDASATDNLIAAKKIEASYAGIIGKTIEPAIKPLGYDWKIGIGLLTSFAAREVFIGTMATIYSIGTAEEEKAIRKRMADEINPETGEKVFNFATSLSLLVFFIFAMQCMSTLAVVRKETGSWKWPIIQFVFMSALAYLSAFIVYQIFS